ncbi:MAG TPA: LptA/OstA family protein, partial [Terriglobia bacterium]|nr:LptA/OstA family protein [Terriglobia bacterium]
SMKLKRLGLYRVMRVVSWILPVIIIGFVFIAAWSYLARSRNGDAMARGMVDSLPPGLEVSTSDAQYDVSDAGKSIFRIKGRKMLTFPNRTVMEDVEVLIYARRAEDSDRTIRGAECSHDKATNQIACNRNVSVGLEPGTIAHTQQLLYDHANGVISSPVHTTLERAGEMSGTAGRMEYFVNAGQMRLTDKFDIRLVRGGGMNGGAGEFHSRENWAAVSGGLELTSGNGRILGNSGRAELLPGTYRPKKVTVDGKASAEAPSFNVSSDWLQSELSDAGDIEHVLARGNVNAERKVGGGATAESASDSLNGTLRGPEVEGWLENGVLKVVEARQHPFFESGTSGTLEASESIRIEPSGKAGSLRTQGVSNFKRDGLTIDGSNFVIAVKDDANEQVFNTTARATLTAAGLKTSANTTNAHFDTKTKTLTSMLQTGNVTFEEKGGRTGNSGRLTVRDGGNQIEMEEANPVLTDAQGTLYASKITLDRKTESFVGDGGSGIARMVSRGSGSRPVVILARRIDGRLGGENPRVDYTGSAEMYPGDDSTIKAAKLTLFPKDKRVEAAGSVFSQTSGQEVRADQLEFRNATEGPQVAYYKGNVTVSGDFAPPKSQRPATDKKVHLSLRANDLEVHSRDGNLGRIVARGNVDMVQGVQKGRGNFMEYDVTTGALLLTGTSASPAEVSDADRSFRGCRIQIDGDGTKRATNCENGRVTTSINKK